MCSYRDFNPRSPHGERQHHRDKRAYSPLISIHAPRTGSDNLALCKGMYMSISIHAPRTGSDDKMFAAFERGFDISIHAPRTGSDRILIASNERIEHFNPRSPHGERLTVQAYSLIETGFQSTLPARGATETPSASPSAATISIHAPRTGSDRGGRAPELCRAADFNPRSPHGERRDFRACSVRPGNFNPRSPHGERRWELID